MNKLQVNELASENGRPITAFVTNAVTACQTERDNNMLKLSDYIYSIEPIKYHEDQLWIKTGKDQAEKELGRRFKINYVENAQKDNNGIPLNTYINQVKQTEDDKLTFITGEQVKYKSNGITFTIDHVQNADNAVNDELGNNIIETYSKKHHQHYITDLPDVKEYIDNNLINIIQKLILDGKIHIEANSVKTCQYSQQYDFNAGDTVTIPLQKNTIYNRPAPEVLKMQDKQAGITDFIYKFDISTYNYNKKFIDDQGKLINNKNLSFGSPRQLEDGFISYSGVVTLDDLVYINNLSIK